MVRKRQTRVNAVVSATQSDRRRTRASSASVTPQIPSMSPETPVAQRTLPARQLDRSITPPTISPITNPNSRAGSFSDEGEDMIEAEREDSVENEDNQQDQPYEDGEIEEVDAESEESPDGESDSDFEETARKPKYEAKPKPHRPRSYRRSKGNAEEEEDDEEDISSPELIVFENFHGTRFPCPRSPTDSRVRKRVLSTRPSEEDEEEEGEEEQYEQSKPEPYQPSAYRRSKRGGEDEDDEERDSSPEPVLFQQLNGARVTLPNPPAQSRVRKRAHSLNRSPAEEGEEEQYNPSKPIDYSKPIEFNPYFKRKDFVPEPDVTGNEEWAEGKEWDDSSQSFQKLDFKKMREY